MPAKSRQDQFQASRRGLKIRVAVFFWGSYFNPNPLHVPREKAHKPFAPGTSLLVSLILCALDVQGAFHWPFSMVLPRLALVFSVVCALDVQGHFFSRKCLIFPLFPAVSR